MVSEDSKAISGEEAGHLAGTCIKALLANIPPSFCWKKGADAGSIPTGCPSGFYRSLAICIEDCDDGYKAVAGVCWEKCGGKHPKDVGAFCANKYGLGWKAKDTYIPKSLTNFDSRVPCSASKYKVGALCYRDCNNIAMKNCGIGACSFDSSSCGAKIAEMSIDVIEGAVTAALFVTSFGTSSAATPEAKAAI